MGIFMGIRLFVVCVLGLFFANAVNAAPPACDAGAEGTIVYNKDQKLVQFCNGTNWIGMVAKIGGAGDTLSDLSCASGEVPEWNGAAWICGAGGTGLWTDSGNGYLTYTGTDTGIKVQAITGMSAPTNTLADLGCANDEVLKWDGDSWECAADGGGLTALQGQDDAGSCTLAKDGLIRYRTSGNPKWEYCDGGTTSWLPFRLPQCQNDGTGDCTLSALRSADDPQFIASKIQCGENILGVTGTYGSGSSGAFNFTDVTNAALSTLTTASAITISGIPGGCPGEVTVSGQGSPQISIAGGAWGTSGMINNGETLAVRLTSSGSTATAHVATIEVGSTQDTWSVATVGSDTTPNAFDFTPNVTNAALSTLTTASSVTITGINVGTTVSVSGTGSPQISINGGAWVTSGTITNGQTLAVRLTSSASFNTAHTATVDVGGVTDAWSVTTLAADTTPNAFDFTPNVTNAALSTLTTASSITISGINTTTPVSVSGTGSPQISINGGAWVTSGNITNGQTLAVRLTSSASTNTAHTATVDVGGVTDAWSVTTAPPSDVQTFTASGTWTKPAWATTGTVNVKCVGGGGGGGRGTSTRSPKGGGGGGYSDENLSAALLPGTVAVTIGVGGTGATGNPGDGGAGGNSTFGALVMASGGGGGEGTGSSDGPGLGGTGTTENGGDGGDDVVPVLPENTTNSGAGGGGGRNSTLQPGGTSTNAGDGGDACDGCVGTNNGASPGGGGGAQRGTGAGGNGGSGE
jgi:hypothetical protein